MYSHPNGVLANRTSQSLSTSSPKVKVYEWHRREKKKETGRKRKKDESLSGAVPDLNHLYSFVYHPWKISI